MKKRPISLCIITLNEEKNIERCIRSVPFADDVVVLDSGSSDNTRSIAQSLGARVFEETWRGFGLQKQRSVELAQNSWVLCLDADEELSSDLQNEILRIFDHMDTKDSKIHFGYKIPRISYHLGRWLKYGGWYPDFQTRFFSKEHMQWSPAPLHESVQGSNLGQLKFNIHHYPFIGLFEQVNTNNRYSTLGMETLDSAGQKWSILKISIKPFFKFLELYIIKQGFRDGLPGFIIAIGGSYSYFLKYAKLWEKQTRPLNRETKISK